MTKTIYSHPDEKLHVILDALNVWEQSIRQDPGVRPWNDYEGSFGGPSDFDDGEPASEEQRREAYLAELDRARTDITRLLDLGIPLP